MTRAKIVGFVVLYAAIIIMMLVMHFYIQDRYGHNAGTWPTDGVYYTATGNSGAISSTLRNAASPSVAHTIADGAFV